MSDFIKVNLVDRDEDGRAYPSKEILVRKDKIITLLKVEGYEYFELKQCYIYVGKQYGEKLSFLDEELFKEIKYRGVSVFKFIVAGTFKELAEQIME